MHEIIDDILVVKVGSNVLADPNGSGQLNYDNFKHIGRQVVEHQQAGLHVAIVSSGAIMAGMVAANLSSQPKSFDIELVELQRLASIGWRDVLNTWSNSLLGATVGELLLTERELAMPEESQEALGVIHALLRHNDVPVINENDAVTHREITFGDNDILAATLAARIKQSPLFGENVRLALLSNINGVFEDPADPDSVIPVISNLAEHRNLALPTKSEYGSGGMLSKFMAAEIAGRVGVEMWLANGNQKNAIRLALAGEIGTHFRLKTN